MGWFRTRKGFTLTEIMMVVAITGIVLAIVMPLYVASRGSAKRSMCVANQKNIMGVAKIYTLTYVVSLEDAGDSQEQLDELITEGYLRNSSGFHCPLSNSPEYDYVIFYEGGAPTDVQCETDDGAHKWP